MEVWFQATDRLKSEEELARDEKERLEKLEVITCFIVKIILKFSCSNFIQFVLLMQQITINIFPSNWKIK